ncbi:NAD(P)/FAD-dependent oxidoreductase [Sphingomonas ginkgonis]|uniref:Thioredoxin reductase n=1 Tax=Sphingomonas ginkgonis TaxID=2315330 RepID=A0A429VA05_9SPHN|nr:NAD(P)/FAD-dependent oxidoreductase [Sphingomonas ginkgonis]RST30755.1 NAD(P)/FAD-dependent oxidoreductase [Sphingomonas ginkgonis]
MDDILDCLVVGGGPAGLTAAIYLARFHLDIRVIDDGNSRAGWIPRTRNHAGYPDGINGKELLALMRTQAQKYGARIETARVTRIDRDDDGLFTVEWGSGRQRTKTVLLATGVTNRRPRMDSDLHDEALANGQIRYCPICDGFEVTDKKIGIIGSGSHGVAEAIFLRSYTCDVTLIAPDKALEVSAEDRQRLDKAGVTMIDGPAEGVAVSGDCITVETASGSRTFDSVYPSLGSDMHTQLGVMLGCTLAEDGCFCCDDHQRTSVEGVYAAGDVVHGLDQISHAMGEGGVAATTIRNDIAAKSPILREPPMPETELQDAEAGN